MERRDASRSVDIRIEDDAWGRMETCPKPLFDHLREKLTFTAPGAKYTSQYKTGVWDGKIRLLSADGAYYTGLTPRIVSLCEDHGMSVKVHGGNFGESPITRKSIDDFIATLKLPYTPRDYQLDGVYAALLHRRCVLLSPTASGKSLVIYVLGRFLWASGLRSLIVVPSKSLVKQMCSDFGEYGAEEGFIQGIFGGVDRSDDVMRAPVTVATWQSIYKEETEFFGQWQAVMGDEVHGFKAKSLIGIMTKLGKCPIRVGLTATINQETVNQFTLEGLFGKIYRLAEMKGLMARGDISTIDVKSVVLRYSDSEREVMEKAKYNHEMAFITQHPERRRFVVDLAGALRGNTIVLFSYVEKHGKPLYEEMADAHASKRSVYFVHGNVPVHEREDIRLAVEGERNAIIVASYGTFSQGVNIKAIHNVVFASPYRSYIKVVQSIGRGLRKSATKSHMSLYDLVDDIRWKRKNPLSGEEREWINYAWRHYAKRKEIYMDEDFPVHESECRIPRCDFVLV